MSDISEFETKMYSNFAVKFVDKYIHEGKMAAGNYAVQHIKKEHMVKARPFVEEEFIKRGFTFDA